ncbi:efflux RND transporter periplasmic adaptor subunit [Stieleria sp. ICT_E10.1]|uniref:HlyD family secretion protein n=1 Tax=Stieleria sedimenti TaxID=2976331 RepID=UPI002180476B|nr:efflux RND transporter periplasmic adaptor subunit [Stieleria sedimenti]MCS7470832.1 efflux RND transporter periplasmic adaptor subunit [Stieleria sedimenti]
MRQLFLAGAFAALGAGILFIADQHEKANDNPVSRPEVSHPVAVKASVHAAGRIEGTTENVLIRPQFPGRIQSVLVTRGSRVDEGQVLFRLESKRYEAQRDLAAAMLSAARANRMRLIAGARESEIEAAKQETVAAEARYESSRTRFERASKLLERNAISSQELEDRRADHDTNLALLLAARERYETVKADPRLADLMAADAEIASAEAQLEMAEIDLQRCSIVSPCPATVLAVDVNPGEWISPEMPQAALVLSNTERLRVVADVDERDALTVRPGQSCEISMDASPGQFFQGVVAEIEPRMEPKKIYGGWAGERNETHTRRVWIDLTTEVTLPIGLPVEVMISGTPSS